MPNPDDRRPIRTVLRSVDEDAKKWPEARDLGTRNSRILARELRAVAPLLRDLAVLATCNDVRGDDPLVLRARALADELEA